MSCLNTNSVAIVNALLEHGADPNCEEHILAGDGGGHLSGEERGEVVHEAGLEEQVILDECLSSDLVDSCLQCEPVKAMAGENQGSAGYTPLHLLCSTDTASSGLTTPTSQEMVRGEREKSGMNVVSSSCHVIQGTDLLVAMVKLLIAKGAKVNKVAKGHSPLSLAIVHGHTKVCHCLASGE